MLNRLFFERLTRRLACLIDLELKAHGLVKTKIITKDETSWKMKDIGVVYHLHGHRRRFQFAQISNRKTATKAWNWYQRWLSRKAGTNFRLEHSVQENTSTVTTAKVVFLLLSNRIFWNGFVNGKQPRRNLYAQCCRTFLRLLLSREFWTICHGLNCWSQIAWVHCCG